MDLRRRLIGLLALLLGALFVATAAVQLVSLRGEIEAEVGASTRLVNALIAAADSTPDSTLERQLAGAGLRHLRIRTAHQAASAPAAHPLLSWLGLTPPAPREQAIRIGAATLLISPNPHSEIEERVQGSVRIWSTLLFFFGTTLAVTWCCADRALAPVRELEASLHRLARGDADPALPAFALREFSRLAGAIDHLAGALADARAAQQALARQLIAVQEDERRALARELHDDMGQTLTALRVTATHLERHAARLTPVVVAECARHLRRDLRTCGEQLRGMLKTLRPHGLHVGSLAQTLHELVQGWRGRHTEMTFTLDLPPSLPTLADATALTIYRVVQEALTNAVRHSGARRCAVHITAGPADLVVDVRDGGCGLLAGGAGQRGLSIMRERVGMVGGVLHIDPGGADGLHLRALFPLAPSGTAPRAMPAEALS